MADRWEYRPLYLARFANRFGMVALVVLLPTYIDLLSPSGLLVGLFVSSLPIARTAAILPLGWAGDRHDKRTILLAGLAVSVGAYLAFLAVSSSATFVAARALQGVGVMAVGLMAMALVGELAPADRRGDVIGRFNAWRLAAGIVGTVGTGLLFERLGFPAVYGLVVALLCVTIVGVWWLVDPDETSVAGFAYTDLAFNRRILTLSTFRAQHAVAVTLGRTWIPIYVGVAAARGGLAFGATAVGIVIAAEKATNMVCQPYAGRLSDRYGRARFVLASGLGYGLLMLAVPGLPAAGSLLGPISLPVLGALPAAFLPAVALNGLIGVADSARDPASMALFAAEGEDEGIASSFGIREFVWRPGNVLAPLAGGVLMDQVGMSWVFVLGGAFALSAALTFLATLRYLHGRGALAEW